jgi:RHS repeat-associated protein
MHWFNNYERDNNGADEAMFRRYNRWWSRFDQPDPYDGSYNLGDPQSFNRYAYVQNDPVNLTDPTGLFCVWTERWVESTATLYVTEECYLEDGGGGGGELVPRTPSGGGGFGGGGPRGGGPGGGDGPSQPVAPSAQPQSQTVKADSQQQGFNDCARSAYRDYRKTYLRTSGLAILGGAGVGLSLSTMIGIRGVGFGIRGVMHAAGDEAVPLFGRILTTISEYKDSGVIATGFAFIGGGMARQGIREAGENSARTEARLKDCERQFPNANHSLAFLNF